MTLRLSEYTLIATSAQYDIQFSKDKSEFHYLSTTNSHQHHRDQEKVQALPLTIMYVSYNRRKVTCEVISDADFDQMHKIIEMSM